MILFPVLKHMARVASSMNMQELTGARAVKGFERKTYDVTDTCCQVVCCLCCPVTFMPLIPGVMGSKTLSLEEEEAVLNVNCPCCKINTRRPYGELGSVDAHRCCCCVGVGSELSNKAPIYPGTGCNVALVDEIVAELKKRQQQRGDQGQIQRTEQVLQEVRALRAEVAAIMQHLDVQSPVAMRMAAGRDEGGALVPTRAGRRPCPAASASAA